MEKDERSVATMLNRNSKVCKQNKNNLYTMKQELKLAAFDVGDTIEYIGDRISTTYHEGQQVPNNKKGLQWEVIETYSPEKGYGFIKNDEDGEPIIDYDKDGHNLIRNEYGFKKLLWPENKKEWKLITSKINK